MRKNVTQITYDRRAPFIYPESRDTSAWKKESRYDLDFGRREPMATRFSIAVLPFANLGGDSRQDYLADGITDSLTTDLSRALAGSFIVSRDTALTYKGRIGDVRRIGRKLDVRYALTGSVFPDGEGSASTQSSSTRRLEHSLGQNASMSSEPTSWKSRTKLSAAWQEPSA